MNPSLTNYLRQEDSGAEEVIDGRTTHRIKGEKKKLEAARVTGKCFPEVGNAPTSPKQQLLRYTSFHG